jgi:adenylosuccinate synthase
VIGITKAYATRVGEGPFPTQLDDAIGQHLRDTGGEYGSVTGRPRRTGWLDIAALRYAKRVNGLDGLAITKLDVLTGLDTLKICVGYKIAGGTLDAHRGHDEPLEPIYETLAGWREDISGCRTLDELPAAAVAYLRFMEAQIGAPIYIVSVGPRRDETIVVRDAMA